MLKRHSVTQPAETFSQFYTDFTVIILTRHGSKQGKHLIFAIYIYIYTVSQKRDPDIIDCNFGKD